MKRVSELEKAWEEERTEIETKHLVLPKVIAAVDAVASLETMMELEEGAVVGEEKRKREKRERRSTSCE